MFYVIVLSRCFRLCLQVAMSSVLEFSMSWVVRRIVFFSEVQSGQYLEVGEYGWALSIMFQVIV